LARANERDEIPVKSSEAILNDAFILGGVRTPFAQYGVGVAGDQVEDIIAGCVNPAHEGMRDVPRWAALAAALPDSVACATINRFCGSSLSMTPIGWTPPPS
jgi:Thiolase, N-terminal domain